jgi:hypothetical protein
VTGDKKLQAERHCEAANLDLSLIAALFGKIY